MDVQQMMTTLLVFFAGLTAVINAAAPSCQEKEECKSVSLGGQYAWSCWSYDSCNLLTAADTYFVNCYGYHGCREATLTTKYNSGAIVKCYGFESCKDATIITGVADVRGYLGALSANIKAISVEATGHEAMKDAEIRPSTTGVLDASFIGYYSGQDADIICSAGETCHLHCNDTGCAGTTFYCYSQATCSYNCHDDSNYCPTLVGGVQSALTDPQIRQIYLENKKVKDERRKQHRFEDNDFVTSRKYQPKDNLFMLDLNQISILISSCLFLGLSLGLCLWNCKASALDFKTKQVHN
eukprot:233382_1